MGNRKHGNTGGGRILILVLLKGSVLVTPFGAFTTMKIGTR